jgi:hypothetical protein
MCKEHNMNIPCIEEACKEDFGLEKDEQGKEQQNMQDKSQRTQYTLQI